MKSISPPNPATGDGTILRHTFRGAVPIRLTRFPGRMYAVTVGGSELTLTTDRAEAVRTFEREANVRGPNRR